jgi:phospholipid-translocating ATPase
MQSLNNSIEPLLEVEPKPGFCSRLRACLSPASSAASRKITILSPSLGARYPSNLVVNTKYNLLTFLPLVLFNQFKYFQNFFFLMMALTQFVPALKVGLIFTYFAPLCFVISLTMIREAYEDIRRYVRDTQVRVRPLRPTPRSTK